jgi:hypothetical protein
MDERHNRLNTHFFGVGVDIKAPQGRQRVDPRAFNNDVA